MVTGAYGDMQHNDHPEAQGWVRSRDIVSKPLFSTVQFAERKYEYRNLDEQRTHLWGYGAEGHRIGKH